ncbi:MAG TPA: biopolymer transporter ExbD [Candidatus Sulfotelmatobacter sp.]
MATPPRRWVGYALVVAGLSLLFDTYTFLRTNWSPLRVPMYAPTELALGYSLAVVGVAVFFGPTLVGMIDSYAPDDSMKMGAGLAHESVEFRRQRRLPLKRKFTVLPNRGLVGGAMILLLLAPAFVMITQQDLAMGIYVRLAPQHHSGPDDLCLAGPIGVTIDQQGSVSKVLLNGAEVSQEELEPALKSKLAARANWEVFVEVDDSASFADSVYAIDVINDLHAKAVILTPKLKQQMTEKGCPRR